jgi:pyruvyltransferase
VRVFQANTYNVGDSLQIPIVGHFLNVNINPVGKDEGKKLMVIGSELHRARKGDVIWGQGIRKTIHRTLRGVKVLAVRGVLAHEYIHGVKIPDVYGDPALLMPLIYNPETEKKHKIGIIPHFSDKDNHPDGHVIHVSLHWRDFIKEILSCERIISSSLHGIILAEAYGIPAEWAIFGNTWKWRLKYFDYLTGTGREIQYPGELPPIPDLKAVQKRLIKALYSHYGRYIREDKLDILSTF